MGRRGRVKVTPGLIGPIYARCINHHISYSHIIHILYPLADYNTHTQTTHALCLTASTTWSYLSLTTCLCLIAFSIRPCFIASTTLVSHYTLVFHRLQYSTCSCFIASTACWCNINYATWSRLIASTTSSCLITESNKAYELMLYLY